MSLRPLLVRVGLPIVLIGVLVAIIYPRVSAQNAPGWLNQDDNWETTKGTLQAFGERFATSDALFDAFRQAAGGGARWGAGRAGSGRAEGGPCACC